MPEHLLMELPELRVRLGIASFADAAEEAKYAAWLAGASKAVKNYCRWDLDWHAADVQYYDGNGKQELVLRNPFTWSDNTLAVRVDQTGAYGYGPNAFAAATALTRGTDYVPRIEEQTDLDGVSTPRSRSGLLVKLQNLNSSLWWPSDLFYRPSQPGGLAGIQGAYWPGGVGNIKVTSNWGFKAVPEDIKIALTIFVSVLRNTVPKGGPLQSESLLDYSYSLGSSSGGSGGAEIGTVKQLLESYVDFPI